MPEFAGQLIGEYIFTTFEIVSNKESLSNTNF